MKEDVSARISKTFREELKDIAIDRRKTVDKDLTREISITKLTEGITKFPEFQRIKEKLKTMPRKENLRRGLR